MAKILNFLVCIVGLSSTLTLCDAALPIVMWHGMGDACCLPFSLGSFKKYLEESIPGVYVKSLEIGDSITEDIRNGYFMSPNKQVEIACEQIRTDPNLDKGFNAIGFSQGAQFMRAAIQRCGGNIPPVNNFISLGGQHQGVYGLPMCNALKLELCDYIRRLLNHGAYHDWVQNLLAQATYWHDPLNEDLYKKHSKFLADINNENDFNETYVTNLQQLNAFVMVKFEKDSMVTPPESSWFGFYAPGQAESVLAMTDTDLYKEDRLGLEYLYNNGRIAMLMSPGDHLHFTDDWFEQNIMSYLTEQT